MKGLSVQLTQVLEEYDEEFDEKVNAVMSLLAKEASDKLTAESPKKTGRYAIGWTVDQKPEEKTYTVYNQTKPSLTHLLENGHLSKNQYGTWGKVEAKPHIKPVAEWANAELVERLTRELENG